MKIAIGYGEIKKIKIDEGDFLNQIFYIKYKEKKAEITTVEERIIDMMEGVGEENIYKSLKNIERTRKRKPLADSSVCIEMNKKVI